jgi:N-acetyl-alpha-D-muramate 1-phosphate uridylyltransferase
VKQSGLSRMQAVILAGGLGTRLRPLTLKKPKAMVEVLGKPFLEYELLHLKRNGFEDFVLCVGYKSEQIREYFRDGTSLGVSLIYSSDGERQLGPVGALKKASRLLRDEFMVIYGDSFLMMDYPGFKADFRTSGKLAMMSVLENRNSYGRSDVVVENGLVTEYNKTKQSPQMVWINFGATMLRKGALDIVEEGSEMGEERFYNELIVRRELAAFITFKRFNEIGTLDGLGQFEKFLKENGGRVD